MKIYKIARERAFHGSTVKIDAFTTDFAGQGHDAEGPGIYFTSDESGASWYGENIHEVELNFNKFLIKAGPIKWDEVKKILLWGLGVESEQEINEMTEEHFYDTELSNWDENPRMAFNKLLSSIKQSSTDPMDAFLNVWINVYRQREKEFLNNMVKLGYDGAILPNKNNTGVNHYVVYNPAIISKKH